MRRILPRPRMQLTIAKGRDFGAALRAHGGFRGQLRVRAPDYSPDGRFVGVRDGGVMGMEHAERPARDRVRVLRVFGPPMGTVAWVDGAERTSG